MPELPEVEVICRGLARSLPGKRIIGLSLGDKQLREQATRAELESLALGHFISRLSRRGKYLLIHLDQGATVLIHLGMTGRLLLLPTAGPALPHGHITIKLTEGQDLVLQDARRFGRFLIYAPGVFPPALTHVGIEPFSRLLTPALLLEKTRHLKRPIKNFLLDGRMIAGIGNIYACETLFAVRLHPQMPVGQLQAQQWAEIIYASRHILRAAIRQGGTTISDYVNSQGQTGLFHLQLQVYGRTDEPCPRCHTAIARLVQAGRSTFYCPLCQASSL